MYYNRHELAIAAKKYVVSANYRNRDSDQKWLVRESGQKPREAVPHKTVIANGVIFGPSTALEAGFGCAIVANCDSVDFSEQEATGEALKFNFNRFLDTEGQIVAQCETLAMTAEGKALATGTSSE